MLRNYFLITLRSLQSQKGFGIINIGGLAIGMAAFVLISLFVRSELSVDQGHRDSENLYRIVMDGRLQAESVFGANSPIPLAETMIAEIPGIAVATRVDDLAQILVKYDDRQFYESEFFLVDSTVFDVFSFDLVSGDEDAALSRPNSVVLREDIARQYFGNENPIGKVLNVDNRWDLEVTGVVRQPVKSHFRPNMMASIVTSHRASGHWMNNTLATYVRLEPGTTVASVNEGLVAIVRKYPAPMLEHVLGVTFDEAVAAGLKYDYLLEPISDVYLRSDAQWSIGPSGDIRYVYVLSVIALFVLVIACINFINLSTARATARAREVGLRKVLGSSRSQLIKQFLGESTIVVVLSTVLALAIAATALPWFNSVANADLALGPWLLFALALIAILTGALAGFYPALVLSRYRPATVLRGTFSRSAKGSRLRSSLVVFQFAISIGLLVGTGVVFKQLHFMHNQDLGFAKDQVVVLPFETRQFADRFEAFELEVANGPGIVHVAAANMLPGPNHTHNTTGFRPGGTGQESVIIAAQGEVSPGYIETLDLEVVAGRSFRHDMESDREAWMINETAARRMGWTADEAVGQTVVQLGGNDEGADRTGEVVGVFADAHFSSMHQLIEPRIVGGRVNPQYLPVRIDPASTAEALEFLESKWTAFEPGYPFRYFFLDADFAKFYEQEERLVEILGYFSLLAILISCLGLFGLSSFVTSQRRKEIGVRKGLGASVGSVVLLLSRDFTRLVLIAAVIAFPLSYMAMKAWLAEFAYATEIGWLVFAITAFLTLLVAWSTVGWQSIRAAVADPVRSLRYE